MRIAVLFTLAACSSPSPHAQLAAPARPPVADAKPIPDAGVAQALGLRGAGCRTVACADGLSCATELPGGYCASACDATCDGACIEARDGELCAKRCSSNGDCRTDEAYVCDPVWHACLVPNFAAIVAKQCPAQAAARDVGFGPSELLPITGGLHDGPAALLDDQGAIVARADARLARDRKGTLYAVSADGKQIQLATSTDRGATWSAPIAVSDPADCEERAGDCVERPLIVASVDAKTKADVLYVIYAAGDHGARVRSSRDGGKTWAQGPIALAGSYGSAVASGGKLHLAMLAGSALGAYGSAQQVIEYTASSDGGATFREPVTVSARDEMLPYWFANPSLAVDDRRKWLYVAYARGGRDAAWEIAIAASKDNGVTWKRTKLAGNGCAIHMVPNLALDAATGTLHVAYYDSEGAPGRFVHATCGPGATKCKLVGSINSTPFATLSLARHTSKSVGDYASLVVDDKRRLLHAVWAQPVDETGKAIARVFHGTAKLAKR